MEREIDEDMPEWLVDTILSGMRNSGEHGQQLRADLETVLRHRQFNGGGASHLTPQQVARVVDSLPKLNESDLARLDHRDGSCPVCMNTLLAAIAEEELAQVMDSPMLEDLGVTRAESCGHIFCRKCLLTWVRDGHPTCPMCRTAFIKPSTNATPSAEQAPESEEDFDAALSRIVAAYQDERTSIGAAPIHPGQAQGGRPAGFTFFGAPLAAPEEDAYVDDRSEFSGMYS